VWMRMTPSLRGSVKFGSINNHSPMRGNMGHLEASQGDFLLVVEPDYLLDSEVLAFSRVYTP
jgi:hypothetical protein